MAVSLVLDTRERGLAAALTTLGVPYTMANLDVGDFLIQAADGQPLVVVERKSLADFAASNQDGRYREQRARLMAVRGSGVAVAYVLEGRWSGHDDRPVGGTRTTEGQLRRLTTRLVLRYGMPVIASDSIGDTAAWCRILVAQLGDDVAVFQPEDGMAAATAAAMTHMTAALSTTKKANRTPASVSTTMLAAIPGLGEKRVTALLVEKSVAELAVMSGADIGSLIVGGKRLGPALGTLIAEALSYKTTA
jgi:ERCC4-type nuclease